MIQAAVVEPPLECSSIARQIRTSMEGYGITPRRVRLQRGRLFALSDGSFRGLHLLVSGHLKFLRFSDEGRVLLMDLLEVGELFGENAILGGEADASPQPPKPPDTDTESEHTSYVQALTDATIDSLSPLLVQRILRRDPALTLSLARLISRRRIEMERRLLTQVFDRVPVRLAGRLLALAERYGVPEPDRSVQNGAARGLRLSIVLSQQDLANWIGASREIVSLTLSEFRRAGALRNRGRTLVIYPKKLRALGKRCR